MKQFLIYTVIISTAFLMGCESKKTIPKKEDASNDLLASFSDQKPAKQVEAQYKSNPIAVIAKDTLWGNGESVIVNNLFHLKNNIKIRLAEYRDKKDQLKLASDDSGVQWCEFEKYLYKKYGGKLIPSKLGCIDQQIPVEAIAKWFEFEKTEGNLLFINDSLAKVFWADVQNY